MYLFSVLIHASLTSICTLNNGQVLYYNWVCSLQSKQVNKKSKKPSKRFVKQLVFQIYREGNFDSNGPTIKKLGELIDKFHQQVVVLRFSSMHWYCVTFLHLIQKLRVLESLLKLKVSGGTIQLQCTLFCAPFHNSSKQPQPYKSAAATNNFSSIQLLCSHN